MAKLNVEGGTTSFIDEIILEDDSVSTGVGKTGVAFGDAGMSWYYKKQGDAAYTAITLATMTEGTWATGGFIESDSTNAPGSYEIGIPDAAIAAGFGLVTFYLFDSGGGFRPLRWQYQDGISIADINATVDTALADIHLDHLMAVAESDTPVDNSIIAKLAATGGDWSTFTGSQDALESIANNIGLAADTDLATDLVSIQFDTTAALTRIPAALSTAGNIKADIEEVNEAPVGGDGETGTEWGPQ